MTHQVELELTNTYVDLVITGPGIQGPPGPAGPGGGGGGGASALVDLTDVEAVNRVDGSVLIYDAAAAKFKADNLTTKLTLTDGGAF